MPAARRRRSRWTSFVADPHGDPSRMLHEDGNPHHRVRVEHDDRTLLVHLSDEDGAGWTVIAVDRATRRCVVAQARRQIDAAREAYARLQRRGVGRGGPRGRAAARRGGPSAAAAQAALSAGRGAGNSARKRRAGGCGRPRCAGRRSGGRR